MKELRIYVWEMKGMENTENTYIQICESLTWKATEDKPGRMRESKRSRLLRKIS